MLTRFDLANELMADALDVSPARRVAFVLTDCEGDAELRCEVMRLLDLYGRGRRSAG